GGVKGARFATALPTGLFALRRRKQYEGVYVRTTNTSHPTDTVPCMEQPYQTRALMVPLDPTPAQEQLLRTYCGAARFAYNWTIGLVKEDLDARTHEREEGVGESELTKCLSWSVYSMTPL